jgi:hypothetical protein
VVSKPPQQARRQRPVIAIAGEGDNDRKVLEHLLKALIPGPCPKFVHLRKHTALAVAKKQLHPRVDELRRLALAAATVQKGQLAGIVVHVDFDEAESERYGEARERISRELRRTVGAEVRSALALAVSETEGWLMLFPDAFPKLRSKWAIPPAECRRDLAKIHHAKEHLKHLLRQPPYRESDAPLVMAKAVEAGLVTHRPPGRNRSFTDFTDALSTWPRL